MVLFFVPETKAKTLEELDAVFDVPLRRQVAYGGKQFAWFWGRWLLGRKGLEKPTLPYLEEGMGGGGDDDDGVVGGGVGSKEKKRSEETDATARV